MKTFILFLFFGILVFIIPGLSVSNKLNELKIARAVRKAVRDADTTLLKSPTLAPWRDYLKIAALNLETNLQPLVLIKFDEDISFRNQLKTIIEWESQWQKRETDHFIYYYRWDQPPPEIILEVQDAHFNEIVKLFQIEALEKIPYRYDLTAKEGKVFPFEDLRGGIISPQPFDLQKGALTIFYFINSEPPFLFEPLSRIYGNYFQNPSTSQAYYKMCLDEIQKNGYVSAVKLFKKHAIGDSLTQDWYSSYAFVYAINQKFGPAKIAQFVALIKSYMEAVEFQKAFEEIFGTSLTEFEEIFRVENTAIKR
ncbi:MAG: hypothetical protein ACE5JB_07740 [bacterium]